MNWHLKGSDSLRAQRLSEAMRPAPVRGVREVAKIMGVSRGTVFYAEKSALLKIAKALEAQG